MYRAQNVLSDFKMTLRGQIVADPINTIGDFLDRMDRVLNKVGETDRAKLRLETLKQRPTRPPPTTFKNTSNLWARAIKAQSTDRRDNSSRPSSASSSKA
ncbi:Hypothetical protein FKW44_023005 [Caligus rogercresseyi]|uniref:Uncharacterized protein n=1 Tax=Caligus rogercresseyi TaxID=217165 RepID=A0A7T8GNQ4_CALRO|nr:Hypothetical protein FKW44_023005 [Caligus rogercresseyi]